MAHDNGLSLESILRLRGEAFATIRMHSAEIMLLADAVETLDAALQQAVAVRGIDGQQALVAAGRALALRLDAGGTR